MGMERERGRKKRDGVREGDDNEKLSEKNGFQQKS